MSTDIHDKIRSEVGRRLAIARAATPGPWSGNDEVIYDADSSSILVGPWGSIGDELLAYVLAHDPADAIRRYEYAQKVLTRHATKPVWNGGDLLHYRCDFCGRIESAACDDVADLAESLGIDTGGY